MSNFKQFNTFLIKNATNRMYNTSNAKISQQISNRNPRNLEKMRIAYKPSGYHLEKPGKCFWHKLKLSTSERHVTASIEHFQNGDILKASTKEWSIKKQLYRTYDTSAFINIGRVLAQRCLEAGITEIRSDIKPISGDGKMAAFLNVLQENGITLTESEQFLPARPWDMSRPEKPWDVTE